MGLVSILISRNFDDLLGSILRGLTWFFCGPLPHRHRPNLKGYHWSTINCADYGNYDNINLYYEPNLPAVHAVLPTPLKDKNALLTGVSKGSIGVEIVKGL